MPRPLAAAVALPLVACAAPAPDAPEAPRAAAAILDCPGRAPLRVTFVATQPPVARLDLPDGVRTLTLTPAASGARYEGGGLLLWTKGDNALFARLPEEMIACTLAPVPAR